MTLTYESEVAISRPPADVFPYLVEPAKQALWSDVPMRPLTDGPFGTGTRFEVTFGKPPLRAILGLEMTALEPDRRLAFSTFSGPIRWQGEYRLESEGPGSRLRQRGTLEFRGLWRLVEPMVGAEISRGEVKELERIKAIIEATSAA
jgi:hypothetical protein